MTIGHGVDIVEVQRIKNAAEGNQRFIRRVFTEGECAYCNAKRERYTSYAVRFAAKEAFLKAIGTGLSAGICLKDIEVCVDNAGRPYIVLHNKARDYFTDKQFSQITLSMSHTGEMAMASVIIC